MLAAGAFLWLAALASKWPLAVTFEDEAGYLGEVRLLMEGRLHPLPESPGVWIATANGNVSKFPLLISLLVAPLFVITPRLVFISGVSAALALAFVASRVLKAWGRSPAWALIILAHPTIVILARTMMADLPLAMFSVAAWWALRRHRSAAAMLLLLLVVGTKATGFAIASALVAGEAIRSRQEVFQRDSGTIARLAWGVVGVLGGAATTVIFNLLTFGKWSFAYSEAHGYLGTPQFWPKYFWTSAPTYLSSLIVLPPALVIGAWPFWRRREIGPLFVVFGLTFLMCFYFFVDHGRTKVETLVLAPRLLLPAVAFLLVGYAEMAAGLAERFPRAATGLAPLGVILVAISCFEISSRHHTWQEPTSVALSLASKVVAETGSRELGLTATSVKAGILYPFPIVLSGIGNRDPNVVLCNTQFASYRAPRGGFSCVLPGYQERQQSGSFHILIRQPR